MESEALIYCENEFGKLDGKVANGLVRHSEKFKIVGVIDSTKTAMDAGEYLDGIKNGVPIFKSIYEAIANLRQVPEYLIYGMAPLTPVIGNEDREVILSGMKMGMDIVNGLPEFFSDDPQFSKQAAEFGVKIYDVRKPLKREHLHAFTGKIKTVKTPVVAVLGTDCAVGKRTTAVELVKALRAEGVRVVFIATGQTGLLQGAKYGFAIDVLSSGFASGAVEHAVVSAYEEEKPDIIVVEGQGALGHPAFTSSSAIIRGAMPDAIILQHPPNRKTRCDFPDYRMPTIASEIELLEVFSKSKVVAITLNHEGMDDKELDIHIRKYEEAHGIPVTDVLTQGCDKLVAQLSHLYPLPLSLK
ncbi:DUF1611 domain-containing protein [Roseivirga sp. E12]|uniref:DUF1611 domain-containing protein n=1 Tax=Roseivirga sp. E12 TaxID=2819237 RepID=UPI001ABC9472|nr:DUF1611 domain-containing protein [Roseivirga sp. E12]MBO3697892.1 DUF1611 domain-containing protein [Roseivirga sp. E12]